MKLAPFDGHDLDKLMSWFSDQVTLRRWGGPNMHFPFDRHTFLQDLGVSKWSSWSLLDDDDNFVGFGQLTERFNRHHFGRLVVDPGQRGKGYGRRLLELLIDAARAEDAQKEFGLYVYKNNTPAYRCYLALGFKEQYDPTDGILKGGLYMVKTV